MRPVAPALALALALLLCGLPAPAAAGDRSAREVVVRGRQDLGQVLAAVTRDAWREGERVRPVLLIVDVTPFTAAAGRDLRAALEALGEQVRRLDGSWRLARLGDAPGPEVRHPWKLAAQVEAVLAEETPAVNTLRALGRTLAGFREQGGVAVYLADWRAEDDWELEAFIGRLRDRGQQLSVIGSEACFLRGWQDGFYPLDRGRVGKDGRPISYAEGIGRRPFGPEDPEAPYHAGDTAWPHVPIRLRACNWFMEFPFQLPADLVERLREYAHERERRGAGEPEDLAGRLPKPEEGQTLEYFFFPLSSSWGPWGLMRACAETGGNYFLWSFNPFGRTDLRYDYSRCNLFPPDLRSRRAILADLPRRPVALAALEVWHRLANERVRIPDHSPPLSRDARSSLEMREVEGANWMYFTWHEPAHRDLYIARAERHLRELDAALPILAGALAASPPRDDVDRRYRADAELFLHSLEVARFDIAEGLAAARETLGRDLWQEKGLVPVVMAEVFIPRGGDPDEVHGLDVRLFHPDAGARILELRRDHLRRYGGTPFGELVARNDVCTRRIELRPLVPGLPPKRTPSESSGPVQPTPGGSGGGGPSTGR